MSGGFEFGLIALAVLIFGLIVYTVNKDNDINSKIRSIAHAIEELNREVYKLDKRLTQELEIIASLSQPMATPPMEPTASMGDISELSTPILESLDHIEGTFSAYKEKTESRLRYLEERIRNLSLPTSISGMDDEKVISRYSQGMNVDAIAKELHLSKAEVEFVLKINQLR